MLSRAMDNTLKFWDWRFPSDPINTWDDLFNYNSHTNICLSPDEKYIVTGNTVQKGKGNSSLSFYLSDSLELVDQIEICDSSLIRCEWHPKINQILTTAADGNSRIYFDPELSTKGAINCITKEPRKQHIEDIDFGMPIMAPHALPDFKVSYMSATRKLQKEEEEKREKTKKKYVLGSSSTFQQYIMKNINKNTQRDEDPREALARYQEAAEKNPFFAAAAYAKTQPKPIYNTESISRDSHRLIEETVNKICTKCGLKFCVCKNDPMAAEEDEANEEN